MKINNLDQNMFISKLNFKIKKLPKKGVIISAVFLATGMGAIAVNNFNNSDKEEIVEMVPNFKADISLESINDMQIIINDSDCSDEFFESVCEELENDGISFRVGKNDNISNDAGVVITLDQQYSSGLGTVIFAPHDNSRLGDSDSLAIAMQAAFKQNGFLGNDIICGKTGYKEEADGSITTSIPTNIENIIDNDSDISLVTISLGTQNTNPKWVAKSIENGLARQKYYLDNYDRGTDLIYRAKASEDVEIIADYFNSNVKDINKFNNINGEVTYDSQAIINPNIQDMEVFNFNSEFSLNSTKTRAY